MIPDRERKIHRKCKPVTCSRWMELGPSGRKDLPRLREIEIDEGFALEDPMAELGRLEPQALGYVEHGDVPPPEDV
jgi:hypothetical protein